MIAYYCDANLILVVPFKTRNNTHFLQSYNNIMQLLRDHQLRVNLKILKWQINYQLVPPNTHQRKAAERAIRTFKAHFSSVLASVALYFPRNLWYLLLPHTEVTIKLLRQTTIDPSRSSWAYFHGPFNYNATLPGPLWCFIISHKKMGTRNLWDFRSAAIWNVGVVLQQYHRHTIVDKSTKSVQVLDTVKF